MATLVAAWPTVALGEVALPVERPEVPQTGKTYRQVGVKLWGQGAYERESIDGSQTQYSTLSRVEPGDIIVNKIWARNGSVSVVSEDLAGCFVSGEFPTFRPMPNRLLPQWFRWLTKTRPFWDQCDEKSRGTSGKNRIRPEKFLEIQIPLPPLDEQRRIVARIEELAARIEQARGLRREAMAEAEGLLKSSMRTLFNLDEYVGRLEDACDEIIDNLHSNPAYEADGVPCVRSPDVGWGTLNLASALRTTEAEYQRRTVRGEPMPGDIVLVREGGGTGKAALVVEGNRFSLGQRVMMIRPDRRKVTSRYFLYQLLSPAIYEDQIIPLSKGSASPHLNIRALRKFRFELPALSEQQKVVEYLDHLRGKVEAVKGFQAETAAELEALLPSVLDRAFRGEL